MPSSPPPAGPSAAISAAYDRYVDWVCRGPRRATLLLFLASLPALVLTVLYFADVHAGLQDLLPAGSQSVRALDQIHARLGGQSHLTIIAHSPDADANRRFIDEIGARLEARHLPEVRSLQSHVRRERAWLEDRAPLLIPADRFAELVDKIEEAIRNAKAKANPLFVDLEGDSQDAWGPLKKRIEEETQQKDRFPAGYLETTDGHTVVMLIWLEGSEVDLGPSDRLLRAAQDEAAAIRAKYPASLEVAWNGEVPNLVEEHAAILADLSLSSALVIGLVATLISLYYRSARAVMAVGGTLVPGLLFTFAFGRLLAGSLNSNTAFLGSIIAGNGINYPLIFLAYYRVCDPAWDQRRAIRVAAGRALPGTLGAAATASAAYGGLAASSFKGFSQFGWIGGVGMLTTWLVCFAVMPAAIALLRPPRQGERHSRIQAALSAYFARRRLSAAVAAGLIGVSVVGGAVGAARAMREGLFEMDLRTLRNRDSLARGSASWDRRMSELFGVWLNPVVSLGEDPAQREAVARELERVLVSGEGAVAERVETIARWVPPLAEQEARLSRLRKIAADLDGVPRDDIPEDARGWTDRWFAPTHLVPITAAELPPTMLSGFKEVSGRVDAVVLVYPSLKINYDDGRNVIHFADRLGTAHLPDGAVTGGSFLFMAEILRLVHDEAPRVVATVCVVVALVLLPIYWRRPRRILVTVGAVAAVAILAQSIMVALGVRVNMLNFAAVPITIGVGADYVVNLYGAIDALEVDARQACARMGGAIFLCSLTTVVGYVSLLVAQSGALRSFGWAAVLGEVMAVTTVLLVLPVVMRPRWS